MEKIKFEFAFSVWRSPIASHFHSLSLAKKNILLCTLILLMNIPTFPLYAQNKTTEEFEDQIIEESTMATEGNSRLNYIGVGGAIGLRDKGETALGEGGFSILGRVAFTNNFSVHASAIFNDNDLLSTAITYSKPIQTFYPSQ